MKKFFSNAWVVSIVSGILVFFITSLFLMIYNKLKHKRQIKEANQSVINHLRSYVVDNGLPEIEIIEAVRLSVAREYNIRHENMLTNKEFCEELIKEIVGNIYISNENKIKYLDMLKIYLIKNEELDSSKRQNGLDMQSKKIDYVIPFIAAIVTSLSSVSVSFGSIFFTNEKTLPQDWGTDRMTIVICGIIVLFIVLFICVNIAFYIILKKRGGKKK